MEFLLQVVDNVFVWLDKPGVALEVEPELVEEALEWWWVDKCR